MSLPTSKATKKSSPAVPHEFQPNMEPTSNPRPSPAPMSKTTNIPNYISDNGKENLDNTVPNPTTSVWRSSEQIRRMKDRTQSIKKIMEIPPLKIKTAPQYTRGLAQANQYLQLQEWARGGAFWRSGYWQQGEIFYSSGYQQSHRRFIGVSSAHQKSEIPRYLAPLLCKWTWTTSKRRSGHQRYIHHYIH